MTGLLKDTTAIVGVGTTDFGLLHRAPDPERTSYGLATDALALALADAGLEKSDIDGLICVRVPDYMRMATILGMPQLKLVNVLDGAGRMAAVALQYAVAAIAGGLVDTVAIVYGNNGKSVGAQYGGGRGHVESTTLYDAMYGMTSPGAAVAHMFRRYQHEFGVPDDALAPVAINNRRNGALNPHAVFQQEITAEQYGSSKYIAEPLRLFDYCVINDGGVALIVTSAERAKDRAQRPAVIGSVQSSSNLTNYYTVKDYYHEASKEVAGRLYAESGIGPEGVDCAQIYDNFTPTVLFSLEGFGFCERGTAWEWVREGRIEREGPLPVNTSGGHTSESYMQGFGLIAEAVRQVRGDAGPRQLTGCETALYCCVAPITNGAIFHR